VVLWLAIELPAAVAAGVAIRSPSRL